MRSDLHMHSNYSDGALSPTALVGRVVRAGIERMSLTDHDTMAGHSEARAACTQAGILFVSGVEISALVGSDEVHLLGYGCDSETTLLTDFLEIQRKTRGRRITEFVRSLGREGVDISGSDIGTRGAGTIGRPHVAKAIVEAGAADSIQEAFEKYLKPGTATFVPREMPSAAETIDIIRKSGGIASLAHPGEYTSNENILKLIEYGLNAIEVVHPSHDERLRSYYSELAEKHGLLRTGGSDFHGWRPGDDENLGRSVIDWEFPPNIRPERTL